MQGNSNESLLNQEIDSEDLSVLGRTVEKPKDTQKKYSELGLQFKASSSDWMLEVPDAQKSWVKMAR